jgi:hypothetical protein
MFILLTGVAMAGGYLFKTFVDPHFEAGRLAAIEDMNSKTIYNTFNGSIEICVAFIHF